MIVRLDMKPVGKARPREGGRLPTAYRDWKAEAGTRLLIALRHARWERARNLHRDAVGVRVVAYHRRPQRPPSWMTAPERADWSLGMSCLRLASPDADNVEGAVWDALTDSRACWMDDTQAVSLGAWSLYAAPGEDSHLVVTLVRISIHEHPLDAL